MAADENSDELQALKRVIETCQTQAVDLDMPAIGYILNKAEVSLAACPASHPTPRIPRGPALSVPRGSAVRH